jgi:membrane fusion protein (multidrug efflux system)
MADIEHQRFRVVPALALSGGLLSILFLLSACSNEAAKSTAAGPVLPVRVVRVEPRPLEEGLDVTGSLVSAAAVDVKTRFAGRLVTLLKQQGDHVQKGELLAGLEETDARLALNQARATLEVAQATLNRARVAEEHAGREFERAQNLLRSGGITDRDFQATEMTARDARAQVKLAEAQLGQAQQAVAVAQKRLSDCRIVSPINGEVDRKLYNPGGWVDANALLYKLVDNQRLELETYVASSDLGAVRKGQKVRFSVAAYPGETFEATITHISAAVDMMNRSELLRAAVPNPAGKLKAGMFVKGRIITGVKPTALVVPPDAVWRRVGQPAFVYVVEQNRARRREVKLGLEQPQTIEVSAGLRAGDLVVAEQSLELADGVSVTPRP